MFEYDQNIVKLLLEDNREFKQLYHEHTELKEKVHDAETGAVNLDELTLGKLKKEKLLAKDKMAAIIEQYRRG